MAEKFSVKIEDVVSILGLTVSPRTRPGASNFNVRCPFCDTKPSEYHMNINTVKDVYFCPRCMDSGSRKNTGALDLYGRVRFGVGLVPGKNGKELYIKLRKELDGDSFKPIKATPREIAAEIQPLPDDELDLCYRTLLSLPALKLCRRHAQNLMKRGLLEEDVRNYPYASLIDPKFIIEKHPMAKAASAWYIKNHVADAVRIMFPTKAPSREEIIAGYLIAGDVLARKVKVQHVSGFFKLAGAWVFRYTPGIAIPTFSLENKIVGLQIRRDVVTEYGLRYMTVSSKDLPEGPTVSIARTHVAHDQVIDADTTVYMTEGPLKADVILSLLNQMGKKNIAVVAIQGVNNTKGLPKMLEALKSVGVKQVYLAFDMDRTGNIHVANAVVAIRKIIKSSGMETKSLFWDEEYAIQKEAELHTLCDQNNISVQLTDNHFVNINIMARALYSAGIEYNVVIVNGKKHKNHWASDSKGMDDMLLQKRSQSFNKGQAFA